MSPALKSVISEEKQWPNGLYGFVKAVPLRWDQGKTYGCPPGFNTWQRTQNLESEVSSSAYNQAWKYGVSGSPGERGLIKSVSWQFCMKRSGFYPDHERDFFPEGQYCIIKHHDESCPFGFEKGWIFWDDENNQSGNKNSFYGTQKSKPDGQFNHDTKIFFCCRNDGSYRDQISLPKSEFDSFGLTLLPYKQKRCQRVAGKIARVASYFFDTEDDSESRNLRFHSDDGAPYVRSLKDGFRFYVCVYETRLSGPDKRKLGKK